MKCAGKIPEIQGPVTPAVVEEFNRAIESMTPLVIRNASAATIDLDQLVRCLPDTENDMFRQLNEMFR